MSKLYTHIWTNPIGKTAPEFDEGEPMDVMERLARAAIRLRQAGCTYQRTIVYENETHQVTTENWGGLCA